MRSAIFAPTSSPMSVRPAAPHSLLNLAKDFHKLMKAPFTVLPTLNHVFTPLSGHHLVECRANETARIFGEPVDYRFSVFGTNVYPRGMYTAARDFIVRMHDSFSHKVSRQSPSFEEIMADTGESWAIPGTATSSCTVADRQRLLSDFEFMDAFMW